MGILPGILPVVFSGTGILPVVGLQGRSLMKRQALRRARCPSCWIGSKAGKKILQCGSWLNLLPSLHFRLDLPLNDWEKREKDAIFIHGLALDDTMVIDMSAVRNRRVHVRAEHRLSVCLPDCFFS
jgi:hypothetical protein